MRRTLWLVPALIAAALVGCASDADGDGAKGADDCDDNDATVYVGAEEQCDGVDNDCDGVVDEDDAADAPTWFSDSDGDGFGDAESSMMACSQPDGFVEDATDCDDATGTTNPDADEACGGGDEDCDGEIDEDDAVDASMWFLDSDGDLYGDDTMGVSACEAPEGYVADDGDCDDLEGAINPDADEVCDGEDNDCDGEIDGASALDATLWYADADDDTLGDPDATTLGCEAPDGYVDNALDCDDTSEAVLECCISDSGVDDLIVTSDTSVSGGVWHFDKVVIEEGATLTVTGNRPLVVYANAVDIAGVIDLSGQAGSDSTSSSAPDGGDAGAGGGGGGGGSPCLGDPGDGGLPNGEDVPDDYVSGGDGGLPYALRGTDQARGGDWAPGGGGGGGGHATSGDNGQDAGYSGSDGYGGESFGDEAFDTGLFGGGGGAGGAADGGGGGGGGGAVAVVANTITVGGTISVAGGDGGDYTIAGCTSGGGGGGGGGAIWLQADLIDVTGTLDASEGSGGTGTSDGNDGGDGSEGRIRVSGFDVSLTGSTLGSLYSDESIAECEIDDDTVYDVQDGTLGEDEVVIVREVVVTAVTYNGFVVQEPEGGEYSGVWVYTGSGLDLDFAVGDTVSVWGTTLEFYGLTEIEADYVLWHESGDAPTPETISAADLAADGEPWEGVLVMVEKVTVADPDLGYGEFEIDEGLRVDDYFYDWEDDFSLSAGDTFDSITGVLWYSFGNYKIEPRDEADLAGF